MEAAITEPAFDELLAVEVTTVDDVSPVGPVGLHEAFRQADNHMMGRLFDVLVGFLNEFVADAEYVDLFDSHRFWEAGSAVGGARRYRRKFGVLTSRGETPG